ncbi:glycosyltransferase family 39 protein [Hymenobacter sp. BRD128]|uniref:ArnT family glycosyltransferase n=1 Tax=Hymenobacter sp. BRD128 TaxID=2675878 RepID=UPI0015679037|nr:glycosyltransferase family 39 protein [Hymenobacter sp. BRD128]QKG57307.1 glycosyltransferase family 39 protein [Hymenobacter sp. BRD128]
MVESLARRVIAALSQRPWLVAALTLALALPALLLHLGWQPLLVDEPIRALVALEMHYSGHFFAPTLQGLPYYNKPPLFNWLLVALFRLTGRQDEFILRLPTIAALLLYTTALWRVLRPQLGSRLAFTVALAFATTGRVLFYDSFLGLIDLWHAGLTWLGFMAVWYLGQRQQWTRLFVLTYTLTAVGFLLKGLPSVVFQGLALLVYFLDTRQWRRLFSWQHVLGVGVMLSILGRIFSSTAGTTRSKWPWLRSGRSRASARWPLSPWPILFNTCCYFPSISSSIFCPGRCWYCACWCRGRAVSLPGSRFCATTRCCFWPFCRCIGCRRLPFRAISLCWCRWA